MEMGGTQTPVSKNYKRIDKFNMNKIFVFILNLFVLLACNGQFNKNEIRDIVKTVDSLKQNYLFDELNVLIKSIEKRQCNNEQINNIIAYWTYFQMDYKKSDSIFSEILKHNPENIKALNGKALIASDNWDTITIILPKNWTAS